MNEPGLVRRCLAAFWADSFAGESLDSTARMSAVVAVVADFVAAAAPAAELHPVTARAFAEAARQIRAETAREPWHWDSTLPLQGDFP
jgi:hypothetical protein